MATYKETRNGKRLKIRSITIIGLLWFDRINGNTYFSSVALINGRRQISIDFRYGYGSHYEWESWRELIDRCKIRPLPERHENSGFQSLWTYCDEHKIDHYSTSCYVARKRDL